MCRLTGSRQPVHVSVLQIHTLLFPNHCQSCGRIAGRQNIPLCEMCIAKLDSPTDWDVREVLHDMDPQFEPISATALWFYDRDGPVRRLHRQVKYGGMVRLGFRLGITLGRKYRTDFESRGLPDHVVPIPVHPIRRRERGFNQAEVIAGGVAKALSLDILPGVLTRDRLASSQVGRRREKRLENLENAFQAEPSDRLFDQHLLLVDDVITTGATIVSALNTLKNVGLSSYSVAAVALVRV